MTGFLTLFPLWAPRSDQDRSNTSPWSSWIAFFRLSIVDSILLCFRLRSCSVLGVQLAPQNLSESNTLGPIGGPKSVMLLVLACFFVRLAVWHRDLLGHCWSSLLGPFSSSQGQFSVRTCRFGVTFRFAGAAWVFLLNLVWSTFACCFSFSSSVMLSGGALFASWKLQLLSILIVKVIRAFFVQASANSFQLSIRRFALFDLFMLHLGPGPAHCALRDGIFVFERKKTSDFLGSSLNFPTYLTTLPDPG